MHLNFLKSYLSLFIIKVFLSNFTDGLRILALLPFDSKSHSIIQLTIMKELAAKGHQVDVYSHYPMKKPIPNYTDFSLAGTMPTLTNNLTC